MTHVVGFISQEFIECMGESACEREKEKEWKKAEPIQRV